MTVTDRPNPIEIIRQLKTDLADAKKRVKDIEAVIVAVTRELTAKPARRRRSARVKDLAAAQDKPRSRRRGLPPALEPVVEG